MAAKYLLELPVRHEPSRLRGHHRLGKRSTFWCETSSYANRSEPPCSFATLLGSSRKERLVSSFKYMLFRKLYTYWSQHSDDKIGYCPKRKYIKLRTLITVIKIFFFWTPSQDKSYTSDTFALLHLFLHFPYLMEEGIRTRVLRHFASKQSIFLSDSALCNPVFRQHNCNVSDKFWINHLYWQVFLCKWKSKGTPILEETFKLK